MLKVLGLDLGNRMICAVSEVNGEMKYTNIESVYGTAISPSAEGVVTVDGVSISLGTGTYSLMNTDKTKREYLKHQILWAVHSLYGACRQGEKHYVKLGVGVPIDFYKENKMEWQAWEQELNKLGTIEGTIGTSYVAVHITVAKVNAECHSAILPMVSQFKKNGTVMLLDVGMKTTDCILLNMKDGKATGIVQSETIEFALHDLFSKMQSVINERTGIRSITYDEIDNILKTDDTRVRGIRGAIDVREVLENDTKEVVMELIKRLNVKFGDIYRHELAFIGGGSELFLQALGEDKEKYLFNSIDIKKPIRYYANALGYFYNAKVLKA